MFTFSEMLLRRIERYHGTHVVSGVSSFPGVVKIKLHKDIEATALCFLIMDVTSVMESVKLTMEICTTLPRNLREECKEILDCML